MDGSEMFWLALVGQCGVPALSIGYKYDTDVGGAYNAPEMKGPTEYAPNVLRVLNATHLANNACRTAGYE